MPHGYNGAGDLLPLLSRSTGSVYYTRWVDVIHNHASGPTPELDTVANAFRRQANGYNIDLTGLKGERVLGSFSRKRRSD